jgi:(S)-mandelate dehydrogenase
VLGRDAWLHEQHASPEWRTPIAGGLDVPLLKTTARACPSAPLQEHALASPLHSSAATLHGSPPRRLYAGRDPARAMTVEDLRAMAHRRLPGFALEYLEGGAEEEATLMGNRAALALWRFVPRAMRDVSTRDTTISLFGRVMHFPFAVAPSGLNGLFWRDADRLLAEAAAAAGIPFIQSTMSNVALETIATVPNLRHWYQLYVFGDKRVRDALISRARDAQCEALVLTIDAQTYGDREWNRRWFTRPGRPTSRMVWDAARHPRWILSTLGRGGMPRFDTIIDYVPDDQRGFFSSAFWVRRHMDRALDWDTLADIRALWPRMLLVKGLLGAADVKRAAAAGADGVILSNHGGRQLDWAVSAVDALPAARAELGPDFTLIADGGIRRGTDVVKALALGADAVLAGRAILYGVAAAGRDGAARAIELLGEELDRDMALLGVRAIAEIDGGLLTR